MTHNGKGDSTGYLDRLLSRGHLQEWRRVSHSPAPQMFSEAALLGGVTVTALMEFAPLIATPTAFFGNGAGALRDLALPTVIYGCAATLFATLRPPRVRAIAYSLAAAVVLLIALARLVLAQEWVSLNSAALLVGVLWVAAGITVSNNGSLEDAGAALVNLIELHSKVTLCE